MKKEKTKKILSKEWDDRAKGGYVKLEWVNSGDLLNEFLKFIKPVKKDIVVDLGTGTGKIAEELSGNVNKIYGIDYSQKMLDLAPKKVNIEYICADAKDLGALGIGRVDKIIARMVFHHLKDNLDEVLDSCRQMLFPKGSFFLCEGVPPTKRAYDNWKETNILLEKDRVFNTQAMWMSLFKNKKFKISNTRTMAIRGLSTRNWLESRGESKEIVEKIINLRKNMDHELKKDWNAKVTKNDVYVDTYWFFLKAEIN